MAEIRRDTAVLAVAKRAARMISVPVAHASGGCVKTTIATNLASAFANAGLRTAPAEGDRQSSALHQEGESRGEGAKSASRRA